jgi:hypothetical protein
LIVRLLNLLMRRRSPPRELFVHEDDWGQIEALPASCAAWCAEEMARIGAFATEHRAPDGSGWTDMYLRQPAPTPLASLAIPFDAAASAIAARLPSFDVVVSGTFSAPQPVPNVRAFGTALDVGLVLVPDRGQRHVAMISLILGGEDDACAELVSALAALPSIEPLLIADWPGGRAVLIAATEQTSRDRG